MFILTEAAGKLVNTLILLPTHSSAKDFDQSDNTQLQEHWDVFREEQTFLAVYPALYSI